jgi:predicted CopG family antitoxin
MPSDVRDHMARVAVSDEVWSDFRAAADQRSLSSVLAELVEREVQRYRQRRVRDGTADDRELLAALVEARELQRDLTEIVGRLERRLDRHATSTSRHCDGSATV